MTPPPMKGPVASGWRALASPWTSWFLMLWIGVGFLFGMETNPSVHPAATVWLRLPLILVPFAVLAAALDATRTRWWALALGVGWAVVVFGGAVSGRDAGILEYGRAPLTESYTRVMQGRAVQAHLGGVLTVTEAGTDALLRLGVGEYVKATARLPMAPGPEVDLGPWAVWWLGAEPGGSASVARLRLKPRAGGQATEQLVRAGNQVTLPDGATLSLNKLSTDFRKALGPAAQITVSWGEEARTAWHFVAQPDLDARVGEAPWVVELLSLSAEPVMRFGVRRRGPAAPAQVGWGLMLLGLLAGVARKEAT